MKDKTIIFTGSLILLAFGLCVIIGARLDHQAVMTVMTAEHQVELDRLGERLAVVQARLDEAMRILTLEGAASWYGTFEDGNKTTSGEIFDRRLMTAAVVFPLKIRTFYVVTRQDTGASVRVWANDRIPSKWGRIADLSEAAAEKIGMIKKGIVPIRLALGESD